MAFLRRRQHRFFVRVNDQQVLHGFLLEFAQLHGRLSAKTLILPRFDREMEIFVGVRVAMQRRESDYPAFAKFWS